MLDAGGTLYGTTGGGGTGGGSGAGAIFSMTPSGSEKAIHSFDDTDGGRPFAGLINVNGTLYSTTEEGGSTGYGTVFDVTTSGTEKAHSTERLAMVAKPTGALSSRSHPERRRCYTAFRREAILIRA